MLPVLLLVPGLYAGAQPSLEHTYPISASICKLEKLGEKYFSMDVTGKQCRIYNLDHTLYRQVSLTVPADYYMYNIQYVSQHLFNQDDLIEFVYTYSKYNLTETSYYYSYETVVINENGTVVMGPLTGAGYTEVLETENNGRKFLVYVYDFYQIPATTMTMVYSLPDEPSEPLKSDRVRNSYQLGNPWPNPSGGMFNIPVKLPPDVDAGELILYNIHGQEVMRHPVEGHEEVLKLQNGTLLPGTYIYNVKAGKALLQGKKVTVH